MECDDQIIEHVEVLVKFINLLTFQTECYYFFNIFGYSDLFCVFVPSYGFVYFSEDVNIQSIIEVRIPSLDLFCVYAYV